MKIITQVLLTAIPFWILDGLWLGVISKTFYKKQLGHLMTDQIKWAPALIFYALYPIAIYVLIIQPALEGDWSLGKLAVRAAVLGVASYAAYDLTNHATIKNWPAIVTYVDIAWGACVATVTALIAFWAIKASLG